MYHVAFLGFLHERFNMIFFFSTKMVDNSVLTCTQHGCYGLTKMEKASVPQIYHCVSKYFERESF